MDHAHVADAGQRHVQGARDGRGGEGKDIHLGAHLLEAFLVGHAKAVFLVDDDQAEVVESDVLLQDPVGADDDVHRAGFGRIDDLHLLLMGAETAQHLHLDGIGGEPFGEGGVMLLRQDRSGDQDGNLHTLVDGLERRTKGDLGLAVAHVAANQAVHGLGGLHVGFHFVRSTELVGSFHVGERVLEVALPRRIGVEPVAGHGFAGGV